jgi:predicted DNA-binding transcriptional regulator AlpA
MGIALASVPKRIIVNDDDAYMTLGEVCERFVGRGCSRMWVRRQIQKNHFPEPIKSGNTLHVAGCLTGSHVEQIMRARFDSSRAFKDGGAP